jgi:hypothetical protein
MRVARRRRIAAPLLRDGDDLTINELLHPRPRHTSGCQGRVAVLKPVVGRARRER